MRFRRVTVSLLVPHAEVKERILIVKFRTKRNGKYGVPGGGLEIDENLFEAASAEAEQELGLTLPAGNGAWNIFAIRCNPHRDSNLGKPLTKVIADCPPEIAQLKGTAEHNFDMVLLSTIGYTDVQSLKPTDPEEIEAIVEINVHEPPDKSDLPISDDLELLNYYSHWIRNQPPLPIIMT